jgi:formylglycine-generating enzyme required for sulfatase activity
LGLSEAKASRILAEEQEPIRQSQDEYEAVLIGLIEAGHYPLYAAIQAELQAVQHELGVTDEEVATIAPPILAAAEEDYQARLVRERQQEYEQKLNRYEKEFSRSIAAQYPLEEAVRAGLTNLQQSLGLRDEDVARLEQPLIAPREVEYQQQQAEQRQREEKRQREEAKRRPPLKRFEFQVPTVNIVKNSVDKVIEKPGFFGKKTEVVKTIERACNITYQRRQADYFVEELGGGVTLEMLTIAGGTFMMGSPNYELKQSDDEKPEHRVTVSPFYMGKFAVTQSQWRAVAALAKVKTELDPDPAHFKGAKCPVEQVSWYEAVEFCDRLSQKTGRQYRLPSEAEWEYACRAGTQTPFYVGETIIPALANYDGNYSYGAGSQGVARGHTTEVGTFSPNELGLYDMHGNVWEWCLDHWHENYQGAPANGTDWATGGDSDKRLTRGGSWFVKPWHCRSAYRSYNAPDNQNKNFGFRVVCILA